MLLRLLSRMDEARFRSSVISLTGGGTLGPRIAALGVPVTALGMRPAVPRPRALWRLVAALRAERPHVLQTWLYHADLLGLLAGRLAGLKAVVWNLRCSRLTAADKSRSLAAVVRLLAALSDRPAAVVVNSSAGRLAHEELGYRPRRWELIPNGFDTELFRPSAEARASVRRELGLAEDTPLVGLVGRYFGMKDHPNFLAAAARLHRARPDVHFLLAGEGVEAANPALARQVASLGLEGRAHLLGERADAARLTAAFDVACSSSYGEGFPNVVGEAMACGVPCVVTDVGDSARIVGECGLVVAPRDPAALAEGLRALLSRPDRPALGVAARERIRRHYSIEGVARRYEALYEEVAQRP